MYVCNAGQGLCQDLRERSGDRYRRHSACQDEWRYHRCLVFYDEYAFETGGAAQAGSPDSYWEGRIRDAGHKIVLRNAAGPLDDPFRGGIFGCGGGVMKELVGEHYTTCGPDAWVVFSFGTTGRWNESDVLAVSTYQYSEEDRFIQRYSCNTASSNCTAAVAPEPITMVLLGTGLAGLSGAGLLRRRRRKDELELEEG